MTLISSHVLDSVLGDHAKHIKIVCQQILADGTRKTLFETIADEQGRIAEEVSIEAGSNCEMAFQTASYFASQPSIPASGQIIDEVVVRFKIPADADKIHIPMMLSPHSYSIWWSS